MKEKLLVTAKELIQPPKKVADSFESKREQFVFQCNQIFLKRPDLNKLVGPENIEMAKDNNNNFARFMASLFEDYQPEVFIETVLWVFRAYRSHGFSTTYWPANINIWIEVLKKELDQATFSQIYPFYHWLIINIPLFVKLTDPSIQVEGDKGRPSHG